MRLLDFSAAIYINNKASLEYQKTESRTPDEIKMTCWIASEQGKQFDVRGRISTGKPQYLGVMASVKVDGHECPAWNVVPPWTGTMKFDCLSNSMTCRKLMFKNINFTDDESALANHTDDIGKIVMTFQRGKFTKARREDKSDPVQRKGNPHAHNSEDLKVHERSKKGREHQVGLLPEESPDPEPQTTYTHEWDHSEPLIIFEFKFTSLYHLQAMDIAPRTRISNRLILRSTNAQPLLIDARTRKKEKVKLERLRTGSPSSSNRKPSPIKAEVIDLTLD